MFQGGMIHAHGGQGAEAGSVTHLPRLDAILRGTTRTIRVWQGHGTAEEFTVDEARLLCRRGDSALMDRSLAGPGLADLMIDDSVDGRLRCLTLPRQWLIAFLAALRRALRAHDTAQAMAPKPSPGIVDDPDVSISKCIDDPDASISKCIDDASEPGAWARHLRHTAPMRGVTDSS